MATKDQMKRFYEAAGKSSDKTASGNYIRFNTDFMPWTDEQQQAGEFNGATYVDTREAKHGIAKAFYTDSVSSCCALAARTIQFGPPKAEGALSSLVRVQTFLAHVVDESDTDVVADALLDFQPNFNASIELYMFSMQVHVDAGRTEGRDTVGFSGAVGGLLEAYGDGALETIARQTKIVTGYQGQGWNNREFGVYVRDYGIFPVSSLAPALTLSLFPSDFKDGWTA